MSVPRSAFVPVMDHEIHVTEWGTPDAPALLMMHGLARTGRDFDELAAALSERYHVLCPDMIGRGLSSWSSNPEVEYSIEYYAGIASDLMDHYRLEKVSWLGTSMGGQIGMRLAAGKHGDRLTCLLINDIGPEVPQSAIERILSYVGNPPQFDSFREAEAWLRSAYAPFGPGPDSFWQRMARTSVRRRGNGRLTLHFDPGIICQFTDRPEELTTWDHWSRISTPTHVLYGAHSDLLTGAIREKMVATGPKPDCTEFTDCGHAPTLSRPEDIARVREALDRLG
ncbi:MAG: alpha/beta hydrolase [Sulfitobacter sp.]|nr:alpha/beta hydrolase [Sulfitobacter sp.]